MTVADAHEQAGYKRNEGNASTLSHHPDVQQRVKEIKGAAAAKVVVTVESLLDELEQARVQAMDNDHEAAAVSASKEKGVLRGLRIERSEVGTPGDFDHLSDEELEQALHERLVRLGYLPESGSSH